MRACVRACTILCPRRSWPATTRRPRFHHSSSNCSPVKVVVVVPFGTKSSSFFLRRLLAALATEQLGALGHEIIQPSRASRRAIGCTITAALGGKIGYGVVVSGARGLGPVARGLATLSRPVLNRSCQNHSFCQSAPMHSDALITPRHTCA